MSSDADFATGSREISSSTSVAVDGDDDADGRPRGDGASGKGAAADDDEPAACLICGQMSHGYHFGVLACRACAAFFRRTIAEQKVYTCRQSGDCPIHKSHRNMCRACRFQRCEMLGMNRAEVQLNRDPIGRRSSKPTTLKRPRTPQKSPDEAVSSAKSPPSAFLLPAPLAPAPVVTPRAYAQSTTYSIVGAPAPVPPPDTAAAAAAAAMLAAPQTLLSLAPSTSAGQPQILTNSPTPTIASIYNRAVLCRMLEGYRNFQASQKSLCTVIYPDNIFAKETYRMVQHDEFVKMERGCLSLMFSMLNEWFQPFDSLPHCVKVSALRTFSRRFIHANGTFRTTLTFPDVNDTRYVLHYGQYMDGNNAEHFICTSEIVRDSDRRILVEQVHSLLRKWKRVKLRMLRLGMRDVELIALAGVMLWNDVAALKAIDADAVCARIYAEIHADIASVYGIEAAGARLGIILSMIHDFNMMDREINESMIVRRIFYSCHMNVWDDET